MQFVTTKASSAEDTEEITTQPWKKTAAIMRARGGRNLVEQIH